MKVYDSNEAFLVQVILNGIIREEKIIRARNKNHAREIAEDYELDWETKHGKGITINVLFAPPLYGNK